MMRVAVKELVRVIEALLSFATGVIYHGKLPKTSPLVPVFDTDNRWV